MAGQTRASESKVPGQTHWGSNWDQEPDNSTPTGCCPSLEGISLGYLSQMVQSQQHLEVASAPARAGSGKSEAKPKKMGKFRLIATVVKAVKRWTTALNPTYSFGEHKDELNNQLGPLPTTMDGRRHSVSAPVNHQPPKLTSTGSMVRSQSGRVPSGRTFSGRAATTGINHGHKGNLLFKPLPKSSLRAAEGDHADVPHAGVAVH